MRDEPIILRSVAVPDGHLAVALEGEGPPLFLLHGWTLDHRMWRPQSPLAARYRLVTPDRRGFGASDAPPALDCEHEDLVRIADSLGIDRFALVGHSQAGAVAIDAARRYPDRIAALALFGISLHGVVEDHTAELPVPLKDYARLVRGGELEAMKTLWRKHPLLEMPPVAARLMDPILADYAGRDLMQDPRRIALVPADVATLAMPVLASTGEKDGPWRREVARWIGATAPQGESALIEGGGHMCNVDAPDRFNALLGEFLARNLG